MSRLAALILSPAAVVASLLASVGQPPPPNEDESKVPAYTLPDVLTLADGTRVTDAHLWREHRRPELKRLFEAEVYGRTPASAEGTMHRAAWRLAGRQIEKQALGGLAVRKQITLAFTDRPDGPAMHLLVYVPAAAADPAPVFLGLNFAGNHAIHPDPGILVSTAWMHEGPGIVDHRSSEALRGSTRSRWPVERILARGYALATAYYGDLDPDYDDGFRNGVQPIFYRPGQVRPEADEWGAIGAWAWGLSRALDYLESDHDVDARRVAVLGHSRLGKAALWAGAQDERFAAVISNNSGCGGAALSKRIFGETVAHITTAFPHWFAGNFRKYAGREADLPVDQHELLALIAPRPLYVASAVEDRWADPRGEFLGALHAEPVYRLLGAGGLGVAEPPPVNTPVGQTIGYHVRSGPHDVTAYDWEQYLGFADRHLTRR